MEKNLFKVILVTAPDGHIFICMRPSNRLKFLNCKSLLFNNCKALRPYLYCFYWLEFKKEIVGENLSKEEAQELVYEWSEFCKANGVLLNQRIPVPLHLNPDRNKEYQRKWVSTHKEENNRKANEYYWQNREKCIQRQIEYNRRRLEKKKINEEHTVVNERIFFVYTHTTPDGMVYVGQSGLQKPSLRWVKSHYRKNTLFGREISKWGWNNIEHKVVASGLTYIEAKKTEGDMIEFCKANGVSLNERSSGKWLI